MSRALDIAGQALGLAGQVADWFGRRPPRPIAERAAVLQARASRKRLAAARALTAGGRARKLRRAVELEAEAAHLLAGVSP